MPYIKKSRREDFEHENPWDTYSLDVMPKTAGELNYVLTKVILGYARRDGGLNYQAINDILGALEGAKLEFYRRMVVPYESAKMVENGDVYSE